MYLGKSKLLGRITNQSCTSTAQSRLAEVGALELHEVGRWCSVHRHYLLSTTGRGWYCFHDGKSFMKVRQPLLCSLLTHSFLFVFTPHAHYPFGVFLSSCGWLATLEWHRSNIILEDAWHTKLNGFLLSLFWRGAWHIRLEEVQISMRKCTGTASRQKAFRGRDWQTCPGRALANVPRQGTGKASQAGTAKRAQAGHWQTFPGRELASVPRQGTGKRPRQGLQACPGRACTLASVPRQGTGKRPRQGLQTCPGRALANVPRQGTVDVPRQGTVVVPMQGTVGIAKV